MNTRNNYIKNNEKGKNGKMKKINLVCGMGTDIWIA